MGLLSRLAVVLLACAALPAQAVEYLELTDFHLVDGTGAPPREVRRLVARDGIIVAIDEDGRVPEPEPDARWLRIGLHGAWVMPGLIDTHVHVARFPDARPHAEAILRSAVRGGVTAVRDLAGDARALAELERATGTGEFIGPQVVYSALFGGADIYKDGPTTEMAEGRAPGSAPWTRAVNAGTDLRQAVAEAKGTGATNIKLYGDMDAKLVRRIIAEARRQGLLTTAHATVFPAGPGDLVEAGVGSLAHAPYLVWEGAASIPGDYRKRTEGPWSSVAPDDPRLLALYRRMAARGVFLDATLYVYKAMRNYSPDVQADWTDAAFAWAAKATRLAHQAGVRVTTGTDWFEPRDEFDLPHTHEELALLVEAAGFTPMEAIVAATRNGAAALGLDSRGTVQVDKVADLLVLDASPLDDIRNTTRIRMTVVRGKPVSP
ncbi:amidohydrolase family protein [Lysobacter yangpyeongensis]|uniref:Amidohydrolase family protein n=1 Tax=Lysobacter yangpyeongensis TaxID=346182 RepID=A0ABW0SMC4_9GAMM